MADVVRHDVVQLDFMVEGLKELTKLREEVEDLKKKLTGGVGDEALDDLKDSAEKAKKPIEEVKKRVEKLKDKLTEVGKKAAVTAFNGLKKVASVSFKAMAAGIGAAAVGIGKLAYEAVKSYADFEQLKGGVETLFGANGAKSLKEYANNVGKSAKQVKGEYEKLVQAETLVMKNANDAFKTSGLSANAYMETVTSFSASLINSVGGDTLKAANMADTAIVDMADNANKMGTSMELIQNAYGGFAKGNYTMLDNLKLGYGGTKEEMAKLIKDAAKLDKSVKANDMSFGNITKAIHAIQVEMKMSGISYKEYTELVESGKMTQEEAFKLLGTTAKEANFTIAGSLNQVKGAWGNILTAIGSGENLDQCFENLIESVEIFGDNVLPVAERALLGLGKVFEKLAPKIAEKLPPLIEKFLPSLLQGATSLLSGLITALPSIVGTIAKQIPSIVGQIGKALIEGITGKEVTEGASKGLATVLGTAIGGLVAAPAVIKAIKGIKKLKGLFGKDEGGGGVGGKEKSLFGGIFESLAKTNTKTVLKGMANLAIILGGVTILSTALMLVAPHMAKLTDAKSLIEVLATITAVGLVGTALSKMAEITGKIPVSTVAKGLANMAIILVGMGALLWVMTQVFKSGVDFKEMFQVIALIGILGTVGAVLSVFAGIVGMIPVAIVALGLANMAIVLVGIGALLWTLTKVFKGGVNFEELFTVISLIGILGTVGGILSVFAGIVGIIPIPIVLAGLANMGLVLGGITTLILAYGKLSEISGFNEFIEKGGQTLIKIFDILGQIVGSLLGGVVEGFSKSLPTLGENLGKFGEGITPLFDAMKGVDMGGVGSFFTALVGLLGVATGNEIIEGIKKFFGGDDESPLVSLADDLTAFAAKAEPFFTKVNSFPEEGFTKAKQLFECLAGVKDLPQANKKGTTNLSAIASDLGSFNDKAGGFFTSIKDYDIEKTNELWNSLSNASSITSGALETVNKDLDEIVKKVSDLPNRMGDGLKSAGESLSSALVEVWKEAVKASAAPVNKLLSAANWILKEFGSSKKVLEWTPYARGTGGHKGGNALVNDGSGAELIQMPNGRMFIPQGRNVFLPNAPKGMKVLPAERTAQLFGRKSPTFRYANGTGDIDIWSYYDNAKGLVDRISEGISYDKMTKFASNVGKSMVSTFTGVMPAWVDKLFEENGQSLASYDPSKGVKQWLPTVARALKMEGQYSEANVKRTLFQMQTESGGNPRAINLWDSNAKKGIPSKGLMQVIDPTFKAYARAGFNKNIYDPLSNILASVRYATSRYGSLEKAYRGVGYSNGVGSIEIPSSSYSPESGTTIAQANRVENNSYSPVFNFNIYSNGDTRTLKRDIKRVAKEAIMELFESMERRSPALQEY